MNRVRSIFQTIGDTLEFLCYSLKMLFKIKKFLYGCPLRRGTLYLAAFNLIESLSILFYVILLKIFPPKNSNENLLVAIYNIINATNKSWVSEYNEEIEKNISEAYKIMLGHCTVFSVTSGLLLYGAFKKIPALFAPWLAYDIFYILMQALIFINTTANTSSALYIIIIIAGIVIICGAQLHSCIAVANYFWVVVKERKKEIKISAPIKLDVYDLQCLEVRESGIERLSFSEDNQPNHGIGTVQVLNYNSSEDNGMIMTTVVEIHTPPDTDYQTTHPSHQTPGIYYIPSPTHYVPSELSSSSGILHIGLRNDAAEEEEEQLVPTLAQQSRRGSNISVKSSSSSDSDSLPFANENPGTVKRRVICQSNEYQEESQPLSELDQEFEDIFVIFGN